MTTKMPARARGIDIAAAIAFNLLPLIGVLLWGWSAVALIFLYWLENLVIGAFHALKMLLTGIAGGAIPAALFFTAFFAVHYGLFCFGHGVFINALFSAGPQDSFFDVAGGVRRAFAAAPELEWGLASIAALQVFSFVLFLARREWRGTDAVSMMTEPYGRILALHFTILLAGFIIATADTPAWSLGLLVLFKIVIDVRAALRAPGAAPPIA